MKRIHIQNMGADTDTIRTAITVGVRECNVVASGLLTLITPKKDNLDSIVVGEVLGRDVAKRLMNGDSVPVGDEELGLRHESVATVQKIATPQIGLAFYVSKRDIQKLDDLRFDCLIFVPWLDKDGKDWAAKWNAETFEAQTQGAEINLPLKVMEVLTTLTACVNLSSGLGHPSDKEHAKRKFSALRSQGIRWDPTELEKWAVRNGWKAADANELSELSARYT